MPSFWPWKKDDQSTASFEKALSILSVKISSARGQLETFRRRSRRLAGFWTLYSIFIYLLYTTVLVLVVGRDKWDIGEYSAMAGGPAVIYVVRLLLVAYYNFRSSKYQSQLDRLQKQRESTIDRLKAATKYNSTQELLRKYGGEPHTKEKQTSSAKTSKPSNSQRAMTGFLPPPTANIPGRNAAPLLQEDTKTELSIPSAVAAEKTSPPGSPYGNMPSSATSAEFAPNAFASAPQYTQEQEGPRWYDRILDVLLGDDETLPRNRLALICRKCRLVNGQAPPGTTSLEDLGRWRCISCGATNGQESEVGRMLPNVRPSTISGFESSNPEKDSSKGPSFAQRAKKTESVSDQETSDVTQYSGASDASESGESESANVRLPVNQAESTPRRRSARIREMSEEP